MSEQATLADGPEIPSLDDALTTTYEALDATHDLVAPGFDLDQLPLEQNHDALAANNNVNAMPPDMLQITENCSSFDWSKLLLVEEPHDGTSPSANGILSLQNPENFATPLPDAGKDVQELRPLESNTTVAHYLENANTHVTKHPSLFGTDSNYEYSCASAEATGCDRFETLAPTTTESSSVVQDHDNGSRHATTNVIRKSEGSSIPLPNPANVGHEELLDREEVDDVEDGQGQAEYDPTDADVADLRLANATAPPSEASASQASEYPSIPLEQRWDFRRSARDKQAAFGTWLDQDASGNYDPYSKEPQRPAKKRKLNCTGVLHAEKALQAKFSSRSLHVHRNHGDRHCVVLKLRSQKGRDLLRKGTDNWPDDVTIKALDDNAYAADGSSDEDGGTYRLRRRHNAVASSEDEDLSGHPEGRGCKLCRRIGQRCSLLEPDGAYPCDICMEEDEECELLVPPVKKQSCEHCIKKGHACPYAYPGSDHSQPCELCSNQGFRCIAGPLRDRTRVRMDHEGKPAVPKERNRFKTRRYRSCTACRRDNKICSLLKSNQPPPCQTCKRAKLMCDFEPTSREPKKVATKFQRNVDPPPDKIPATVQPAPTPPSGVIALINTKLSHPVTFNSAPNPAKPCHWCSGISPHYPLFGHLINGKIAPARQVKVLMLDNKQGCKELKGGFIHQGKEPSRMCAYCTLQRVKVMFCRQHVFRAVPWLQEKQAEEIREEAGPKMRMRQPVKALQKLGKVVMATKAAGVGNCATAGINDPQALIRAELTKWCAVCPAIATHECCAGDKMECTLRLCAICHRLLNSESTGYHGDFVKFVGDIGRFGTALLHGSIDFARCIYRLYPNLGQKIEAKPEVRRWYPRGLRADYDFYKWEGFMMRQVRAQQLERYIRSCCSRGVQ